jgi:sugar lactone lactonase YvrE/thioredoxin-related protein
MARRNLTVVVSSLVLLGLCVSLFLATAKSGAQDKTKDGGKGTTTAKSKATEDAGDESKETANPYPGHGPAPSLEGGAGWLNTAGDIRLKDLRGKIVLLDFWTYCCINCMHVLPDLAYLEKKFDKEIVVIGVHSAKFDNEKETENIRGAILRYEIAHPVVNDSNMTIWRKFRVSSWPTLVVIDPEGNYVGQISGEGNRAILEEVIGKMIAFHKSKGTLDDTPVQFHLEKQKAAATPLRFPGKILADEAGNRLFISDSNHNRIVVADLSGKVQAVIGSGAIGNADGSFEQAQFDHPQGMDLDGNILYVADTENHLIREIDLAKKQVRTIAGTGVQARDRGLGGKPLETALSSPWDVKLVDGKLYIAMAGPHQIWVLNGSESVRVFAGSGREDIINGPLAEAALAQPSGIATDGKFLYVCDSEGSAIRKIPVDPDGEVTTLVGTYDLAHGRALFEFGDIDDVGDNARLQHPLGIAYRKGQLYVADTYNHKIKVVDIAKRTSKTFLGNGKSGAKNDLPELSEPAGLAFAGDKLYIADTNNQRIQVYDLASKKMSTLELAGLEPPKSSAATAEAADSKKPIEVAAQTVPAGEHLKFEVTLKIPEGYKLNKLAPVTYRLKAEGDQPLVAANQLGDKIEVNAEGEKISFQIPLASQKGSGKYRLSVNYTYCRSGMGGACVPKTVAWLVPVNVEEKSDRPAVQLKVE